jgi:hypothetical protein
MLTALSLSCTETSVVLFDFNRDFDIDRVETTGGMKISLTDDYALRLEKGAVRQYRPSLVLKAPDGKWDLSGYESISIEVKNVGEEPHSVNCIINNPGDPPLPVTYVYGDIDVVTEGALLLWPGEEGVLRLPLLREQWAEDEIDIIGMRGHPPVKRVKDLSHVNQLVVYIQKANKPFEVVIDNIRAEGVYKAPEEPQEPENFFPMIDEFGQYRHREWPGKTHSLEELLAHGEMEEVDLNSHPGPESWDRYGGWTAGPQLEATGFFRVEKHEGKWWLVDPEGRLFWSHGICVVGRPQNTIITDREYMYSFLPPKDDPLGQFYDITNTRRGYYKDYDSFEIYSYSQANLYRKYGEDWLEKDKERTFRRLRSWGLNTIAGWSDRGYYERRQCPYTISVSTDGCKIIEGHGISEGKGFPDPFDPSIRQILRGRLAEEKDHSLGDPWCIGFFVDNELNWDWDGISLAIGTLKSPATQPAKMECVKDLKTRYRTIADLNEAWGSDFASFNALLESKDIPDLEKARADLAAFYAKIAENYMKVCRDEVKRVAPNQLYFGCRFWSLNLAVAEAASKYCDAVSFNRYYYTIENFSLPGDIDLPLMFSEFHFGALDRGMLHPSLRQTKDQEHRAEIYRKFVQGALRNPQAIGTHWFQFRDQETTGRTGDGENYQLGFIDICDKPYEETIAGCREIGYSMYDYRFTNQ